MYAKKNKSKHATVLYADVIIGRYVDIIENQCTNCE